MVASETPHLIRATRRNITEEGILRIYSRENLKSYNSSSSSCDMQITSAYS
jgi:hypothetical protein